ncbi:class I (I, L, M and V) tRNA synthetase, partial [Helicosporidium sp. ATCC 50920]
MSLEALGTGLEDVKEGKHYDFSKEEKDTLKWWDEVDAFQEQLRQSFGRPLYVFYDGPPFATGLPHYGHLLAGTIKDVVTRYASGIGRHVPRRFGWDCHGLPVEHEIDKMLGVTGRQDVLDMGIDVYNEHCRSIVMRYRSEWRETVHRMGRWIDFDNDYKTMDPSFMESVWWVFGQLWKKDLVYKGFKVMPYSTGCSTALSNFEAGSNYKDVSDPCVTIAFKLDDDPDDAAMCAWTTTPWTLPSSLALCVNPELTYVRARDPATGRVYIVADARLSEIPGAVSGKASKAGPSGLVGGGGGAKSAKKKKAGDKAAAAAAEGEDKAPEGEAGAASGEGASAAKTPAGGFEILARFPGKDLEGRRFEPLFPYFAHLKEQGAFRVLTDAYVTADSGTGVVQQAPYFGEDDYRVCMAAGVIGKDSEVVCPIDDAGRFTAAVPDFAGQYIKDADKGIIAALKKSGALVHSGSLVHSYPFCWRSDTPLVYKAVPSWFVNVEAVKPRLLETVLDTAWVPAFVRDKRFYNWLESARDWAVSRSRFWGTPIPLWVSEDGEEVVAVESVAQLEELSGVRVADLHTHHVDKILIPSRQGKGMLRRVEDVFDCWFESGSMPYASRHYPFENAAEFEAGFPADFVAEGLDQTRGWFYTLMVLSTALFDKPAFQNLICNGMVLAADGKKMSKRLKNYPDPAHVLDSYGADALRLYLINSPVVRAETLNFKEEGVRHVLRSVMLPWYNAYRFLVQNVRRWEAEAADGLERLDPRLHARDEASLNVLDRWILAEMRSLTVFVRREMDGYRLYTVVPGLLTFIDRLTNVYVRLNRRRLKGRTGRADAANALSVLFRVLAELCSLMAPFTPFFCESLYRNLRGALPKSAPLSVHWAPLPAAQPPREGDERVEASVRRMIAVLECARVARDNAARGLKIPVKALTVVHPDAAFLSDVEGELRAFVAEECNALEVRTCADVLRFCRLRAEPDWQALGKRLGRAMGQVGARVKALTQDDILEFERRGELAWEDLGVALSLSDVRVIREFDARGDESLKASGDGDVLVVLDMSLDESLLSRGLAREVVNRVQRLKKKGELAATDKVAVFFSLVGDRPGNA